MTIGYKPPPLPEQPVPHVPVIRTSLFKTVARQMRAGTGRRGYTPVSALGAAARTASRERREARSEKRAEQATRAQRGAAKAQQQQARAQQVSALAEAGEAVAKRPRRKRAGVRAGAVQGKAKQAPHAGPSPQQRARQRRGSQAGPVPPSPPPGTPGAGPRPGRKRTRRAFKNAGLGPMGKANRRNPAVTVPLNQPAGMEPKFDVLQEIGEAAHKPISDEDLIASVSLVSERHHQLEQEQQRQKLRDQAIPTQDYNLTRDLAGLFEQPGMQEGLGNTRQLPVVTGEQGESQPGVLPPDSGGPTMILPEAHIVEGSGQAHGPIGPRGNVTRAQFENDVRALIRDMETDAANYDKLQEELRQARAERVARGEELGDLEDPDLFEERRAYLLRRQALQLRSFLPENRRGRKRLE